MWWGEQYIRNYAHKNSIKIIKSKDIVKLKQKIDILLSIQFPFVLKKKVLKSVKLAINLHTGMLPKYRGCNLPYHAILNGEKEFGSALHLIDEGVDSGDIICQKKFKIPNKITAKELYEKNNNIAYKLFSKNFKNIVNNKFTLIKQNVKKGKFYKKNSISSKKINLKWSEEKIEKFVRALEFYPFEPSYIKLKKKKMYLISKPEKFIK